jgi:hypothetical protein
MRVDVERDFSALGRHFRECRHADRNLIADPVSFHDRLVRMFRQQPSAKMRNHRGYCTAVHAAAADVGTADLGPAALGCSGPTKPALGC